MYAEAALKRRSTRSGIKTWEFFLGGGGWGGGRPRLEVRVRVRSGVALRWPLFIAGIISPRQPPAFDRHVREKCSSLPLVKITSIWRKYPTRKHTNRVRERGEGGRERERERVNRGRQSSILAFHLLATDSKYKQVLCTDLTGVIGQFMKSQVRMSDSQLIHNNTRFVAHLYIRWALNLRQSSVTTTSVTYFILRANTGICVSYPWSQEKNKTKSREKFEEEKKKKKRM